MYKTALVERDIEDGKRLLRALEAQDLKIDSAFWFYVPERNTWRLAISSKAIDSIGHLPAYEMVAKVLSGLRPPAKISPHDVTLQSSYSPLVATVKSTLKPKASSPAPTGSAYVGRSVNLEFVEDVYVYRL